MDIKVSFNALYGINIATSNVSSMIVGVGETPTLAINHLIDRLYRNSLANQGRRKTDRAENQLCPD